MKIRAIKIYSIKSILIAILVLFAFIPLLTIFTKMTVNDFTYVFSDKNFLLSIRNSICYSLVSTVIILLLATLAAYFLDRATFKHKKTIESLLTTTLLIPSLSIGLGIKLLFGNNGFIDKIFSINASMNNFTMLIICSVIALFPVAFTTIYDALKYEDKNVYLASELLNISKVSTFFRITLPYLKMPLIYSAFAVFSIIFCDYGIPMEVAGLVKTLPMYLYENMTTALQYGRSAISILILLVPSLLLFIVNLFIKNQSDKHSNVILKVNKMQNVLTIIGELVLAIILLIPAISFTSLAFIKSFPNDISFTFTNFSNAFATNIGLSFSTYICNSLLLSFLTATFGTIIAFIFAYFSTRIQDKLSSAIDVLMTASLAIPGMALGVCYVFFFKDVSFFYRTLSILLFANICHMIGSPYLLAKNALAKQNQEYENVADTLNSSKLSIFFKVLVPDSVTTLLAMFSYFFITSMTTVTAVLFLANYQNQPLSVLITYYDKSLNYEMQAVISVCILVINIICKTLFTIISSLFTHKSVKVINAKHEVKRAIILAAGFGSRMQPLTFVTPKPLLKVNGKVIIESLIENIQNAGIEEIVIVIGYKKEQFVYLQNKYKGIIFVENKEYNLANSIQSLYVAREYLDRCYICEADLILSTNVFKKYEDKTCFLGFHTNISNDWCATLKNGYISSFKIGGQNVMQTCGISYWSYEDALQLRKNLEDLYQSNGGKESIWDMAAFGKYQKTLNVAIREINKTDIIECDTIVDLAKLDSSYYCYLF